MCEPITPLATPLPPSWQLASEVISLLCGSAPSELAALAHLEQHCVCVSLCSSHQTSARDSIYLKLALLASSLSLLTLLPSRHLSLSSPPLALISSALLGFHPFIKLRECAHATSLYSLLPSWHLSHHAHSIFARGLTQSHPLHAHSILARGLTQSHPLHVTESRGRQREGIRAGHHEHT